MSVVDVYWQIFYLSWLLRQTGNILQITTYLNETEMPIRTIPKCGWSFWAIQAKATDRILLILRDSLCVLCPGSKFIAIRSKQNDLIFVYFRNWNWFGPLYTYIYANAISTLFKMEYYFICVDRWLRFPRNENRDLNKYAQSRRRVMHMLTHTGRHTAQSEFEFSFLHEKSAMCFPVPYGHDARPNDTFI